MSISAIILAAGLSRRMGEKDKLFLEYHGKPIVESVIKQVKESAVDEIILVGNESILEKLKLYESDLIKVCLNPDYKSGMTSSIKAGIQKSNPKTSGYMICLGDQPTIGSEVYRSILTEFKKYFSEDIKTIAVPFYLGKKGNPVIFSSYYKESILNHKEPEGCKGIISAHQESVKEIIINQSSILRDIDTPEDYRELLS